MRDPFGIAAQISALLTPALAKQKKYCRQLGLRDRILTLPLMVAAVLTMLWRDVAGVRELTRMLAREGFLWCDRLQVSQQALSTRFLIFPAELFERVFKEILPLLKEKWHQRNCRPLPESVQFTLTRFEKIWIADGSTLEALFKKLKSLEDVPKGQLAGKIGVVVDLMTRLPVEIWFRENPKTNDTKFEEDLLKIVGASTLLLLDRGFYHFKFWQRLIDREIHFISRLKKGADELSLPFDRISLEMIYRGLYHFGVANQKGETKDPVKYFAAPENKDLGIIKQKRKNNIKLIVAPFPEKQRNTPEFFFSAKSLTYT